MKENYRNTLNRRVYKHTRFELLKLISCPRCAPHRGCNSWFKKRRSWKDTAKNRKQWS